MWWSERTGRPGNEPVSRSSTFGAVAPKTAIEQPSQLMPASQNACTFSKGPVIRAEAAAEDKMGALDLALDKMAAQMRRAADRRRIHRGRHAPISVGQALADVGPPAAAEADEETVTERQVGPITVTGDGPLVVREKSHPAAPMTLDTALYEMELVGHDFYLFSDADSGRPSVVYRRKGFDYGVIRLA